VLILKEEEIFDDEDVEIGNDVEYEEDEEEVEYEYEEGT